MTTPILTFSKMNGLGNQILVVDLRAGQPALSEREVATIASQPGLGFDQLMALHRPTSAHADAAIKWDAVCGVS
jgi:diaminopimelate epimerase